MIYLLGFLSILVIASGFILFNERRKRVNAETDLLLEKIRLKTKEAIYESDRLRKDYERKLGTYNELKQRSTAKNQSGTEGSSGGEGTP